MVDSVDAREIPSTIDQGTHAGNKTAIMIGMPYAESGQY